MEEDCSPEYNQNKILDALISLGNKNGLHPGLTTIMILATEDGRLGEFMSKR